MKCKNCKIKFEPTYFNEKFCKKDECKSIEVSKLLEKKRSIEKKKWSKEKKERKERLKTTQDYKKDLQPLINKIARLIDNGHNCMMCGNKMKRINGCHYHSVGSNDSLRFNLLNIWAGCHSCNSEKGGNINGYDFQILEMYGKEFWEKIKFDIVRDNKLIKLSKEELKEKIKISRGIIKELESEEIKLSKEERIIKREYYNKKIGIYKN